MDPEANMQLGKHLATLRGARSQRDVARAAGLDVSTVSRVERGVLDPTISTLRAIARALGVEIQALMTPGYSPIVTPPATAEAGSRQPSDAERLAAVERQLEEMRQLVAHLSTSLAAEVAPAARKKRARSA